MIQPTVRIEQLALRTGASTLSISAVSGQIIAIVGHAGAGKSKLLKTLAGQEKIVAGTVQMSSNKILCDERSLPRKGKVQNLTKGSGQNSASRATDALVAAGLWNIRQTMISDLTPSQASATCFLPLLISTPEVALIDMLFDWVDLPTQDRLWKSIEGLRRDGMTTFIATHSPEIVERCDSVIVLKDLSFRFTGSVEQLKNRLLPTEIIVETSRATAIKNMVEPLTVRVEQDGDHLRMTTFEGQELAQKLLLEGYGDIRLITHRAPTIREALLELL